MNPLPTDDLDHVLAHTQGLWEEMRGQRIFITGGTGFFGCWLLESFAWANHKLGLKTSAVMLTCNLFSEGLLPRVILVKEQSQTRRQS